MRGTVVENSVKIDRSDLRETEENFVADLARFIWPKGTAPEIAARIGCSVRNVELQLSGQQKWSGDAIAAIFSEILRRHGLRNVKVRAR